MDLRQTRAPTLDELDKWISDVLEGRISTEADDGDYELTDDDESEGITYFLHSIFVVRV